MPSAQASSAVACSGGPLAALDTDLLILPWFQDEPASAVVGVDAATGGELGRAVASKEFQGKLFELFVTPIVDRGWKPKRVALVGGGSAERGPDILRRLAAAAALAARGKRV